MALPTGFKYASLFKKHMSFNTETPVVRYEIEELTEFFADCATMFQTEPMLISVPIPVHVVGDIHGQYEDLHRIFSAVLVKNPSARFLFLGDLVDRGCASLQCLVAVLVRKMAYPNKYYVVRGNHEAIRTNVAYGFFKELKYRFQDDAAKELLKKIGRAYQWMPLAALVNGKILALHGGISSKLTSLDDIRNIPRPIKVAPDNNIANDLLWADPNTDVKGTAENTNRGTSVFFGSDEVDRVLAALNIDCIIRAHQLCQKGYDFPFQNKKVITIFSAPGYNTDVPNDGAIAIVKLNEKTERVEIKFRRFEPVTNAYGSTVNNLSDDITRFETSEADQFLKSEEDEKAKSPGGEIDKTKSPVDVKDKTTEKPTEKVEKTTEASPAGTVEQEELKPEKKQEELKPEPADKKADQPVVEKTAESPVAAKRKSDPNHKSGGESKNVISSVIDRVKAVRKSGKKSAEPIHRSAEKVRKSAERVGNSSEGVRKSSERVRRTRSSGKTKQ